MIRLYRLLRLHGRRRPSKFGDGQVVFTFAGALNSLPLEDSWDFAVGFAWAQVRKKTCDPTHNTTIESACVQTSSQRRPWAITSWRAAGRIGPESGPRSGPKKQPSARAHFLGLCTFRAYEVEACPAPGIQAGKSNPEAVFLSNLHLLQG